MLRRGDIVLISTFVGVLTFLLYRGANIDFLVTAVLVGISLHMRGKSFYMLKRFLIYKYVPEYCDDIKAQQNSDRDNNKD